MGLGIKGPYCTCFKETSLPPGGGGGGGGGGDIITLGNMLNESTRVMCLKSLMNVCEMKGPTAP